MIIKAYDYKGKWFVLQDSDLEDMFDSERPDVDVSWVTGEGLTDHVERCLYYGIPVYIGKNKDLHERISKIETRLSK